MPLRELRIDDFVVIESARLEPGDGFTVLTGETGSGKSVCVAALRVALGERADSGVVRQGKPRARIAAVFDEPSSELRSRLHDLGVDCDSDLVTLSREVMREGRGSCRVNACLVSQAVLREVGELVCEVTAQGTSQRLLRRNWQRDQLDASGGAPLLAAREACAELVTQWRHASAELELDRERSRQSADSLQRARDLVADLEPLSLDVTEEQRLGVERLRLRNAEQIIDAALAIRRACSGDDSGHSASDSLGDALAAAESVRAASLDVAQLCDATEAVVEQLRDLAAQARHLSESVSDDPAQLAAVEERLDLLARIRRRFGSTEDALAQLAEAGATLLAAADGGGLLAHREQEVDRLARATATAAEQLSHLRATAARRLEQAVCQHLSRLELPHARFVIVIGSSADSDGVEIGGARLRCGPQGVDEVDFRFAASRDGTPVALEQGVSGGELSRLALAVRAVVGDLDHATIVFDEVDTGVGGETAAQVGELLADIGATRQVIAITHRAEIAARASTHLVARRCDSATSIAECRDEERADEMARLLSGRITSAARARALELLGEGSQPRPRVGRR